MSGPLDPRPLHPRPLDPKRLAELQDVIGPDFAPTLQSLAQSIASAIEDAESALAAGDLSATAYAAHRCRNDAMMVGAAQLQLALAELEAAARSQDLERAHALLVPVRELWPGAREELGRAARRGAGGDSAS
jgi:HPt (histidine-containing phosphotransfer) domain-containing protein